MIVESYNQRNEYNSIEWVRVFPDYNKGFVNNLYTHILLESMKNKYENVKMELTVNDNGLLHLDIIVDEEDSEISQ